MPRRKVYRRKVRKGKVNSLAKRVSKLERTTRPETKWKEPWDITGTSTFCEFNSTAPFDQSILDLAEGVGQHNRIGNQVKIKSFFGKMVLNTPANSPARLFRFVLYNPRDTSDYLQNGGPSGGNLTVLDQIDADRFSVLSDKTYYIAPTGANTANVKQITLGRKFKRMITQIYNTALAGSQTKGDIRLYIVSTQGTGSADKSYLQGYMKTYYIDP